MNVPKVIIGLGNPDAKFSHTRHNIGFQVIDALATNFGGQWSSSSTKQTTTIILQGVPVLLIKPMTYMNNSGEIVPFLKRKGFAPEDVLVIHDELEKPFGKVSFKVGGSARGHNGLRSLIDRWGTPEFLRMRFGIGRPDNKEQVPHYVLERFEDPRAVEQKVSDACTLIQDLYAKKEAV